MTVRRTTPASNEFDLPDEPESSSGHGNHRWDGFNEDPAIDGPPKRSVRARRPPPARDDVADRVHAALVAFGRPVTLGELRNYGRRLGSAYRSVAITDALERLVAAGRVETFARVEPYRRGAAYTCTRRYYAAVDGGANGRDDSFPDAKGRRR